MNCSKEFLQQQLKQKKKKKRKEQEICLIVKLLLLIKQNTSFFTLPLLTKDYGESKTTKVKSFLLRENFKYTCGLPFFFT